MFVDYSYYFILDFILPPEYARVSVWEEVLFEWGFKRVKGWDRVQRQNLRAWLEILTRVYG